MPCYFLLVLVLSGFPAQKGVITFEQLSPAKVPPPLVEVACAEGDCVTPFAQDGTAWAGDMNGDGKNEFILTHLSWLGSGGFWQNVFQEQEGRWIPISDGWQTKDHPLHILPVRRQGYHDLRVARAWCLKWNGRKYVDYEDSDYRKLPRGLFDRANWLNAKMFWSIKYRGLRSFKVEPLWFPEPTDPSSVNTELDDPKLGMRWVSYFKGGVWGFKGKRAFLLVPRPGYLGALKLHFDGDWLLIYNDAVPEPIARFNRLTWELTILAADQLEFL